MCPDTKLRIDYLASIPLTENSGKSKATKEKIYHLQQASDCRTFTLTDKKVSVIARTLAMFWLELGYLLRVLFSPSSKPDLIITRSMFCFGTYIVSKLYRIKLIREVHADFWDEAQILFKGQQTKLVVSKLYQKYLVFFIGSSDGVIFNNPLLEKYYRENYLSPKVESISVYNGANISEFVPEERDVARGRLEYEFEVDKKYLLFVGSVSKWHGVEYILETFNKLRALSPNYRLIIVGGGNANYLKQLKGKYEREDVFFSGPVVTDMAKNYINSCEVCLLPVSSIRVSPGSPLKLYDYVACGKPVIAQSNMPGYSDVVLEYKLGVEADFLDPESAARSIDRYLSEIDLSFALKHNREVAVSKLCWSKVISDWLCFAHDRVLTK